MRLKVLALMLFVVATSVVTSGCASITSGSAKNVTINSQPNESVTCDISTKNGKMTTLNTPAELTVPRTSGFIKVECENGDVKGTETIQSRINPAYWGNAPLIFVIGFLGFIIDPITGAMWTFPNDISVAMYKTVFKSETEINSYFDKVEAGYQAKIDEDRAKLKKLDDNVDGKEINELQKQIKDNEKSLNDAKMARAKAVIS